MPSREALKMMDKVTEMILANQEKILESAVSFLTKSGVSFAIYKGTAREKFLISVPYTFIFIPKDIETITDDVFFNDHLNPMVLGMISSGVLKQTDPEKQERVPVDIETHGVLIFDMKDKKSTHDKTVVLKNDSIILHFDMTQIGVNDVDQSKVSLYVSIFMSVVPKTKPAQ